MRPISASYPIARFRRLRKSAALRDLVQENRLTAGDLIWPVFIREGDAMREPIASMPGVERLSIDQVVKAAQEAAVLGIPAICLFPYTDVSVKSADCTEAWNPDNLTNRAIRAIKAAVPE
ncbi:MAG: porphobilinogen synthase, partial [Cypionkella sp.]|nr:porphobilinogen synthase [Cypionkella sp.]